jgi:secondary thiamine-phosphate synthase enzyme
MLHKIMVPTERHTQMIDITAEVQEVIRQEKISEGMILVYCPHTTAAVTINENADPDVVHDILMRLEEMYPWKHPGDLHGEGNSAAHIKASTIGVAQLIPVAEGHLVLGTWQSLYFCEFDGPRQRNLYIQIQKN